MRFFIRSATSLLLAIACAACLTREGAGSEPQTRATPQTSAAGTRRVEGSNASASADAKANVRIFRGTVGDQSVEMRLRREGDAVSGSYAYDRVGQPLALKGSIDAQGNATLREFDASGKQTGEFKGRLTDDAEAGEQATFQGKWSLPDGSRESSVYLTEQDAGFDGKLQIISKRITDKRLNINAVYPQLQGGTTDGAVMFNRRVADLVKKSIDEYKQAEPPPDRSSLTMNYNTSFASNDIVSVEIVEDSYAGGAYPNVNHYGVTYDLRAGRELQLADILKPGYEKAIQEYTLKQINEEIRKESEGGKQEDISTVAAEMLGSPEGWALTRRGLIIYFGLPHVLAVFNRAFVPYGVLKGHVKPEGAAAPFAAAAR